MSICSYPGCKRPRHNQYESTFVGCYAHSHNVFRGDFLDYIGKINNDDITLPSSMSPIICNSNSGYHQYIVYAATPTIMYDFNIHAKQRQACTNESFRIWRRTGGNIWFVETEYIHYVQERYRNLIAWRTLVDMITIPRDIIILVDRYVMHNKK